MKLPSILGITLTFASAAFLTCPCSRAEDGLGARKTAAEKGSAEAQYQLDTAYLKGKGQAKDMAEAIKWFRKATEQGQVGAQLFTPTVPECPKILRRG